MMEHGSEKTGNMNSEAGSVPELTLSP